MQYAVRQISADAVHEARKQAAPVDARQIDLLRSRPPVAAESLLSECRPGPVMSCRQGDLIVYECSSHWQGPYVPPLQSHLVVVALGPAVDCTTWLGCEGLREHRLQPGDAMILPAGEPGYICLGDPHRLALLALRPSLLHAAEAGRHGPLQAVLTASSGLIDGVIEGLARTLLAAAAQGGAAVGNPLAQALGLHLRTHYARTDTAERHSLSQLRLQRVLDYLDANLAQPLTLLDAATVAGCSVHHFSHLFKAEMGLTPMRYLNQKRMQLARELVETTELSMGDIGYRVGLPNPTRFSQAFKACWKTSPSTLRRRS